MAKASKTVLLSKFILEHIFYQAPSPSIAGSFWPKPLASADYEDEDEDSDHLLPGYLKGRYFTETFGSVIYKADVTAWLPQLKVYMVTYEDGEKEEKTEIEIEDLIASMDDPSMSWPAAHCTPSSRSSINVDDTVIQFPLAVQQSLTAGPTETVALRQLRSQWHIKAPLPSAPKLTVSKVDTRSPNHYGATDFSRMYGPGCHTADMDEDMAKAINELNEAVPQPLLRPNEEAIPRSAVMGADQQRRLPDGLNGRFLSAVQCEQLVTVYRNYCAAKDFIQYSRFKKKGNDSGVKALQELSQKHQEAILRENGYMVTTTGKHKKAITKEIYERVVRLGLMAQEAELFVALKLLNAFGPKASDCIEFFLMPLGGRKLAIMLSLNEITGRPNFFSPEIKLTVLTSAASNLQLALMRRHASAEGYYYHNKKEVEALRVMDPSHVHHNMFQSIDGQQLVEGLGESLSASASVLPLAHLLEAALHTGDPILSNGLQKNCDMHSHAMSRAVLTSTSLVCSLRELGYTREAVILKILGRGVEAWSTPHQTEAARSKALHLLTLLVYRLFGDGLRSTQCLGRATFGGLECKQWLDLVCNADARVQLLRSTPWPLRGSVVDSALGTGNCESRFSTEASVNSSGHKADVLTIQQRAIQLDVAMQFKLGAHESESAYRARISKRQRKAGEGTSVKWNDGTFSRANYDKDLQARARQHNGGHNNHSTRDFVKRRTGF